MPKTTRHTGASIAPGAEIHAEPARHQTPSWPPYPPAPLRADYLAAIERRDAAPAPLLKNSPDAKLIAAYESYAETARPGYEDALASIARGLGTVDDLAFAGRYEAHIAASYGDPHAAARRAAQ